MATDDADDAWCPPTLPPSGFGRTLFAQCTMAVDSHSTRSRTLCRTASRWADAVSWAGRGWAVRGERPDGPCIAVMAVLRFALYLREEPSIAECPVEAMIAGADARGKV